MDEKKSFFASLTPKSALLVGIVAGFLVICTIGFIVLGAMFLYNKSGNKASNTASNTLTGSQTETIPTVTTKNAKPKVELFIMSYCPYGLQMQKAYLPVMKLLGKKADMDIKWVNYIMHQKKEMDENTVQYCLQNEQNSLYVAYAECFTVKGDSAACLKQAKVDEVKLKLCTAAANSKFNIINYYNNTSTYLSGVYPVYKVHDDLNAKYEVQGSPTLIINGQDVSNVSRTPEALKKLVCSSFTTAPSECNTALSTSAASAGFGAGTGTDTAGAECGS